MDRVGKGSWVGPALAFGAVTAATFLGVALRLEDPLSTPMIPAEDPYTHMTYVREHLRDGGLDPMNAQGSLYPPGLHAYLAAVWVFTGLDLYDIVRLGPVLLGALGILGVGLLLGRFEGPVAGAVGALAVAVAAEPIMRTTMMAPTAVDVALLPFFLFALLRVLLGRTAWMAAAVPLAGFFAYSHPWLFSILALAGVAFLVLAAALPWPASRGPRLDPFGLALASLVIGAGVALSVSGCWGSCGPGFRDVLPGGERLAVFGLPILALSAVPLLVLRRYPRAFDRLARVGEEPRPELPRFVLSAWLATAVVMVTVPAVVVGMPEYVNLDDMFGWPILALGFLGFALLPFVRSPLAHFGAAIAVTTYPFVVYNPLQSPFWPHRTAVYFGLGLVILAAVAAAALARWTAVAVTQAQRDPSTSAMRPVRAGFALVTVAVVLGGAVVGATPGPKDDWYRLYSDCDYETLLVASDAAEANPDLVVISGSWQSKLVLASLTPDASRLWYDVGFYMDSHHRGTMLGGFDSEGSALLVVEDDYVLQEEGANTEFLRHDPWTEEARGCPSPAEAPVVIHRYGGGTA